MSRREPTCHRASLPAVVHLVRPALADSGETKFVSSKANMMFPVLWVCARVAKLEPCRGSPLLKQRPGAPWSILRSMVGLSRTRCALALGIGAAALVALAGSAGRRSELLMPWYEVASDGDGLGPESVNMVRARG